MPYEECAVTVRQHNDLLADIDYLSDKADAEGYGRSFLDSAISGAVVLAFRELEIEPPDDDILKFSAYKLE